MTEQPTRDQIIERFQRKMIAALEGRLEMQEVCGLSIESLQATLVAERSRLLQRYGYDRFGGPWRKPPSGPDNQCNDP
jgi:hypothetical protein